MITVSLCMIVKNEEKVIGRCLDSVKDVVDEIIIVDTGSTDKTKEIVSGYTDRIFDFEWIDDFAAARNFSFQHATKEYIFWLDADDVLSEEDQKKLMQLKKMLNSSIDAVSMDYHLSFDETGNVSFQIRRYRLVKRAANFKWDGAVHEYLGVGGKVLEGDVAVQHRPLHHDVNRNIEIYERRLARGEVFSPRDLYYYANELKDHNRYQDAVKYYLISLESGKGWVEDNIQACYKMVDCYTRLGLKDKVFDSLVNSFKYEAPRPEGCYRLGVYFLELEKYDVAIYWFGEALEVKDSIYFKNNAYRTWMPHLQLCVCYNRLENHRVANEQNELAAKYNPEHPSVLYNRNYFNEILSNEVVLSSNN